MKNVSICGMGGLLFWTLMPSNLKYGNTAYEEPAQELYIRPQGYKTFFMLNSTEH